MCGLLLESKAIEVEVPMLERAESTVWMLQAVPVHLAYFKSLFEASE